MSRIKVLVNAIALTNVNTGIGRYVRNLYTELEARYSDVLDIAYYDGNDVSPVMPSGPASRENWSKMTEFFWKLPPVLGLCIRTLFQWKRERRFYKLAGGVDLYHEPGFFPFKVPDGVRTVFTIHDMSVQRHPECHPKERVLFYKAFFDSRSSLASHLLTVSHFSKDEIMRQTSFTGELIDVTYLGYDATLFHPATKQEQEDVLGRLGLPAQFFLFLGTGDPRKNMEVIPRALDMAGLDVPLVVAGWSGWGEQSENGNIITLGYLPDPDLRAVFSSALALVFPSRYEGFGLPVLEAMACGCPVVTTREASMPEVGGEAALYMESPDDAAGLGELLTQLVSDSDLRERHRVMGLARAQEFSWQKAADQTMEVFRKVLEASSSS